MILNRSVAFQALRIAIAVSSLLVAAMVAYVIQGRLFALTPTLVFEYHSTSQGVAQLFFDVGQGFNEAESSRAEIVASDGWRTVAFELPRRRIRALRFDPADRPASLTIRGLRVVLTSSESRSIPLSTIRRENQIRELKQSGEQLEIRTESDADDPAVVIDLSDDLDLGLVFTASWLLAFGALAALWAAAIAVAFRTFRSIHIQTLWSTRPRKLVTVISAAAALGVVLSCAPVIFLGKSLLSPGYGPPLFYDACPTLPSYSDCTFENVNWSDVGAMAWQHFPLTVAQEQSVRRFGEFPLWNRFNSSGTSMVGQGQMMLGDPLNWLLWLVGTDALSYDIKFLLLRWLFGASLGFAVFTLTRSLGAAALVAFTSPFAGYFVYRVNHPAIFTLCYSPLILLAWLKLVYDERRSCNPGWLAVLMAANWLVMNSGTAKEAYMAMVSLNAIGATLFVAERKRFAEAFGRCVLMLVASGTCFIMISAPIWGTLRDAINNGLSNYAAPSADQRQPQMLIGFAENLFYLVRFGHYFPAVNGLLFTSALAAVVSAFHSPELRRPVLVLAAGSFAMISLAYGIVPAAWILAIPILRNVQHIDNTFSTVLVVPVCILAGVGLARLGELDRKRQVLTLLSITVVLGALLLAYVAGFERHRPLHWLRFVATAVGIFGSSVLACYVLSNWLRGVLTGSAAAIVVLVTTLAIARGAQFPSGFFDSLVFNPQPRASLRVQPKIVDRLVARLFHEPYRVLGVGDVLFSGFHAALALEGINGPDALWNRRYRELTEALGMPFNDWRWRMVFDTATLPIYGRALDFLGVGFLLSSTQLPSAPDVRQVDSDEFLAVYEHRGAWPRAFFTDHLETYEDVKTLAKRISQGHEGPFVAVEPRVLENDARLKALSMEGTRRIVKARDYVLTNNTTTFTIDAPSSGIAYLGETDEPDGFVVTVNGKPVPYINANYAFKAVYLDRAGQHRITFRYWPANFSSYLWMSVLGLITWLGLMLLASRRSIRPRVRKEYVVQSET